MYDSKQQSSLIYLSDMRSDLTQKAGRKVDWKEGCGGCWWGGGCGGGGWSEPWGMRWRGICGAWTCPIPNPIGTDGAPVGVW
jgi:hypothetical protein